MPTIQTIHSGFTGLAGLTGLLLATWLSAAQAAERVQVLALFPGKAMLQIDGQRQLLADGESFAGLTLIGATARGARVVINGQERDLRLGSTVSAVYAKPRMREIRIIGEGNSFYIDGRINDQSARLLIDTGATHVALSERHAKKLGVDYLDETRRMQVGTAAGATGAYAVKLDKLSLGGRVFRNVEAMVVEGDSPHAILLGVNVLREFEIEHKQNLMILRTR